MEALRGMVYDIALMGLASIIIETFCPSEKYVKLIKPVFAMIFILTLLTPFLDGRIDINVPMIQSDSAEIVSEASDDADRLLTKQIKDNVEHSLMQTLNNNGISCEKINVTVNISQDNCIDISEADVYVRAGEQREESIAAAVKAETGEKTEVRVISGEE